MTENQKGPAPSEEVKAAPPAASSAEKKKRQKKINQMTAQELETAVQKTQEKMGGLTSRYARELLRRKKELNKPR